MRHLSFLLFIYMFFLHIPYSYADYDKKTMSIEPRMHPSSIGEAYKKAIGGDVQAQYNLGRQLIETPDRDEWIGEYKKGLAWLIEAAKNGHPQAQYQLSLAYCLGQNKTPIDINKGIKWGVLAADQGGEREQISLGHMYLRFSQKEIIGMEGYELAIKWYKKAARQGSTKALRILTHIYEGGWDNKKYPVEAYVFFILSLKENEKPLPIKLDLYKNKLSSEQLIEAEKKISSWLSYNPAN